MPKFRKKPIVIDAVQYDGTESSVVEILTMRGDTSALRVEHDELLIPTLEGVMWASKGDWIIKGVKGELYPCKPDIFEATYELCSPEENVCPKCGAVEVDAMTPRTTYACGSSDYDQRPNTFNQSEQCRVSVS